MSHTPTAKVFILRFCAEPFSLLTNNHHSSFSLLSYLSRNLADRWGTIVDFTTSFLHSSRFSAFRSMIFHSRLVHSFDICLPIVSSVCRREDNIKEWTQVSLSSNDSVVGSERPIIMCSILSLRSYSKISIKENRCWSA